MRTGRFSLKKHHASRLHFDIRMQIGNRMKSWFMRVGPSLGRSVQRVAEETHDHRISTFDKEGLILAGRYGAGPIMLIDSAFCISVDELALRRGYEAGHIVFELRGSRLRGGWELIRTTGSGVGSLWLLRKLPDAWARPGVDVATLHDTSSYSGLNLGEIDIGTRRRRLIDDSQLMLPLA